MTVDPLDPLDLMAGFGLDNGRTWGEVALPFQHEDAAAILTTDPEAPRRHYLLRGRGMSKTTDTAAMALALLLTHAPPHSHSYVYAVDADQTQRLMEAVISLVGNTPGLGSAVEIRARSVTVRDTGATLTVESSDGASAMGTRPWLTVVDELAFWPDGTNHRRLWSAIVSAVPKVPGSRLVVIGTAGDPAGLGARAWETATASPHWRTSRHPGPSPWWSPAEVEASTGDLTPSEYRWLISCEWATDDDALTTPEDVDAAIRPHPSTHAPRGDATRRPGRSYVAALDVGTRRDLTALVVGHIEHLAGGRVVVIDRAMHWRPSDTGGRVDLAEVEDATLRLCREYGARLRFDRMQAEQLTTNLTRQGVRTEEFVFSAAGVTRLARSLLSALRDRALSLPDDPELRSEFLTTRLVTARAGVVKIENPAGSHDDIVTAVGMVVADLTDQPDVGRGMLTVPGSRTTGRTTAPATPHDPTRAAVQRAAAGQRPARPLTRDLRAAAARGPRGVRGIILPGSANDPQRLRSRR